MKKIISLSIVLLLILIAAGGFFWWWQTREIKGSPEDYVIKETEQGKIVENKRAGLTMEIPKGWVEKKIEFLEGSIAIYTSDVEGKLEDEMIKAPLTKGCAIEGAVIYKQMNFDGIKEEIKEFHAGLGMKSEEFEIMTINNRQALKNTFDTKFIGPSIGVYFLNKDKFYSFAIYWAPNEKERCIQEFNKFLETASIR